MKMKLETLLKTTIVATCISCATCANFVYKDFNYFSKYQKDPEIIEYQKIKSKSIELYYNRADNIIRKTNELQRALELKSRHYNPTEEITPFGLNEITIFQDQIRLLPENIPLEELKKKLDSYKDNNKIREYETSIKRYNEEIGPDMLHQLAFSGTFSIILIICSYVLNSVITEKKINDRNNSIKNKLYK